MGEVKNAVKTCNLWQGRASYTTVMHTTDEKRAIGEALAGKQSGYQALIRAHQQQVYSLLRRITANSAVAEDLSQEVFIKAFEQLPRFKGTARFGSWLYRIAYNAAITHIRNEQRQARALNNYNHELEYQLAPDNAENREQRLNCMRQAVDELPKEDRLLITLFYLNDKSIAETASITQQTAENVKVRLFRLRKKLRARLAPEIEWEEER